MIRYSTPEQRDVIAEYVVAFARAGLQQKQIAQRLKISAGDVRKILRERQTQVSA